MFNLIVAALAVWQAINIWHHSSLFSSKRAYVECWDDWRKDLLRCPFCLSPWVAVAMVLWLGLVDHLIVPRLPVLGLVLDAPIHALAVSRVANVLHDLMKKLDQTPKANKLGVPVTGDHQAEEPSGAEQADAGPQQAE